MCYVIGRADCTSFIQVEYVTRIDTRTLRMWCEIEKVFYDCPLQEATIINPSYDKAKKVLNEIQNRISEIDFSNTLIIDQIIDKKKGFDKVAYAEELKIYKLVPTLAKD